MIRELKSDVYTVTAHVLGGPTQCGAFQGKQTARPSARLFVPAANAGICRANARLRAAFQSVPSRQMAGPVPLISEEVLNRNLSSAPWLRELRFSPAATCSRVGGHSTVFVFFFLASQRLSGPVVSLSGLPSSPTLPPLPPPASVSLSHTHFVCVKHKHTRVVRVSAPPAVFTVDSRVVVESRWRPSSLL